MKNIVMYSSSDLFRGCQTGGIKRFIELAEYISKSDKLVLCSQDNEENILIDGNFEFIKLNEAKSRYSILPPEARILLSNVKNINRIKKKKYDFLIVFDVPPAIGIILFGLKNIVLMIRKDLIGYEIVKTSKKGVKYILKLIYQWFCEGICMNKSKIIICQCEYDKEILKKRHPLLRQKIESKTKIQINNVNPSWIGKNSNICETKYFTNIPHKSSKFRVCFIGGFDDLRKGQDIFLKTANKILENETNFEFILIGGGKKLNEYMKKYANNNIFFTGRLTNPIEILKSADLLVVPSLADSCPNTVMEAIYNEIPVIGSNAGGIPEILTNEEHRFCLNQDSLCNILIKMKNQPSLIETIKNQQKKRKEELSFEWGNTVLNIIKKSI